jgi:myosin heavy subunit
MCAFVERFNPILLGEGAVPASHPLRNAQLCERERVQLLITHAGIPPTHHQLGRTKVFLRQDAANGIEGLRYKVLSARAVVIQARVRRVLTVLRKRRQDCAARVLQRALRTASSNVICMRQTESMRVSSAATVICNRARGALQRKIYEQMRSAAGVVQAAWRFAVKRRLEVQRRCGDRMVRQMHQDMARTVDAIGCMLESAVHGVRQNHEALLKTMAQGTQGEGKSRLLENKLNMASDEAGNLRAALQQAQQDKEHAEARALSAEKSSRESVQSREKAEKGAEEYRQLVEELKQQRDDALRQLDDMKCDREKADLMKSRDDAEKLASEYKQMVKELKAQRDDALKQLSEAKSDKEKAVMASREVEGKLDEAHAAMREAEGRAQRCEQEMRDALHRLSISEKNRQGAENRANEAELAAREACEKVRVAEEELQKVVHANRHASASASGEEDSLSGSERARRHDEGVRDDHHQTRAAWAVSESPRRVTTCDASSSPLQCMQQTASPPRDVHLSLPSAEQVCLEMQKRNQHAHARAVSGVGKFEGPDGVDVMIKKHDRCVS